MEIIDSSVRQASRVDQNENLETASSLQSFDFWAVGKQGNSRFVSTARFFQGNGSNAAELLVSATVPHPIHVGVTALLPLLLIHYPLSRPGALTRVDSVDSEFSAEMSLFASREMEELVSVRAAELLSDIHSRGGVARLPTEPGSIGMSNLSKELANFKGEVKRLAARKITMSHRLELGKFHFRKSNIGSDLSLGSDRFTALELHIATYFNFLKSIGYLQVRDAAEKFAGTLLRDSKGLFSDNELHSISNNRKLFVRALLARLSRQQLLLNTRAD